jgi:hypothetical protein
MAVIYPDIETTLVTHFKSVLSGVYIATKKHPPTKTAAQMPDKQLVIQVSYANDRDAVTKFAGVVLDVYAPDDITASNLALEVEAKLRNSIGAVIKKVDIIAGPIRLGDETEQEKRSISAEVVVKATNL